MRKKNFTLDGASVVIGALTCDQVDRYVENIPEGPDQPEQIRRRGFDMVCWSLNNGLGLPDSVNLPQLDLELSGDTTTPTPWTMQKFRAAFDLVFYSALTDEILSFSGLHTVGKSVGESPAAAPAAPAVN